MAKAKKGLGRGLNAMIPGSPEVKNEENANMKEIDVSRETLININEIEPNKKQPRKGFDEDAIQELADSIKKYGVIQPLILQRKNNFYEIIAGERRWRAARLAGLKEIPAIIKDYTPQETLEIALVENIQREDLNPIEEAKAFRNLIDEFNLKHDEVAERLSKSRVTITNALRLLKLDERVQQMVIDGMLSNGHARTLLSIEEGDLQFKMAMRAFDEKLSVRETEKLIRKINTQKAMETVAATSEDSIIYRGIEDKIKEILGSKVSIKRKANNKGKIEIEYYSNDDLERIIDLLDTIVS